MAKMRNFNYLHTQNNYKHYSDPVGLLKISTGNLILRSKYGIRECLSKHALVSSSQGIQKTTTEIVPSRFLVFQSYGDSVETKVVSAVPEQSDLWPVEYRLQRSTARRQSLARYPAVSNSHPIAQQSIHQCPSIS